MMISPATALQKLAASGQLFTEVFTHGSLSVEIYRPQGEDLQTPHSLDEVYVVISGSGTYVLEGKRSPFSAGDVLFAPAGAVHRFEHFSTDFATWVFFYGPEGGEQPTTYESALPTD